MYIRRLRYLALVLCMSRICEAHASACPPEGYSRPSLEALSKAGFEIPDEAKRNGFARALLACLEDPDPKLRDDMAFEALSHFLRGRQLSDETMRAIEQELLPRLTAADSSGVRRPFAALALSEIARADRVKSFLSPEERARLLAAAIAYFTAVKDYRGFDEHAGWRHGVAHGADYLLQLGLNPAFGASQMHRILSALETQIAPAEHSYIYGEPQRIARVVLAIAERGLLSQEEWATWVARISAPAPFPAWGDAYASQAGLARIHNLNAFLSQLYIAAKLSGDDRIARLLPPTEQALKKMP
jgi:hypothetical protein